MAFYIPSQNTKLNKNNSPRNLKTNIMGAEITLVLVIVLTFLGVMFNKRQRQSN